MSEPRLDVVTLLVSDLDESTSFYRDVLGLTIAKESGGYVELAARGGRLALFPREELSALLGTSGEQAGTGSAVVSFEVDRIDDAFEAAVRRGAEPFRPPGRTAWGKRLAFLRDPDGNLIELHDASS